MRRLIGIMGLILAAMPLFASAQSLPPVNPAAVTGDIIISGSDTLVPLTQQLVTRFSLDGYTGNITLNPTTTEDAITALCNGTIDIALAGRQITPQEVNTCQAAQVAPLGLRVATDAVIVVVSNENGFVTGITTAELNPLFTTAANWSDIRAEFPAEPINRLGPASTSGTFRFFVDAVFGGQERPLLTAFNSQYNDNLTTQAQSVVQERRAVAFFSASFLNDNNFSLRRLTIDNITPTQPTVVDGSYPLARPLFLYTSANILQTKTQVADFVNYYLTNVTNEAATLGLYAAGQQNLNASISRWFNAIGQTPPASLATPVAPTAMPVIGEPSPIAPDAPIVPTAPAEDTADVALFEPGVLPLLVQARADLETLADDRLGASRPLGWNGELDIDNRQLPVLIRVDLEILAAIQYGQDSRPDDWFGAIGSTQLAIAQDIRHDLDVIALDYYGSRVEFPSSWTEVDPLLACDRPTRSLVTLLERSNIFDLQIDPAAPDYCTQVEQTISRFTEVNLLRDPDQVSVFSGGGPGGGRSSIPGNVIIDSEFAVGFYDRSAVQKAGTIPLETRIEPLARSYTQFSNMTLVRGENFVLFVDWLDTSLTAEQFMSLPDVNEARAEIFCDARFCR